MLLSFKLSTVNTHRVLYIYQCNTTGGGETVTYPLVFVAEGDVYGVGVRRLRLVVVDVSDKVRQTGGLRQIKNTYIVLHWCDGRCMVLNDRERVWWDR